MLNNRTQYWQLVQLKLSNQNLRRHCLAVEAAMRALARHFGKDEQVWGIVGLLHDGDYEQTKDYPTRHTQVMLAWLEDMHEERDEIKSAIRSHNYTHTGHNPPGNLLEWSLFCSDELTGLITACALVQPSKKLSDVTLESVLKKFSQKSFAAGAKREDIQMCEQKLNIPLPDFVKIVLLAMQSIAPELGL
jgi:putative nucleotidyltransferase with HDIG domain